MADQARRQTESVRRGEIERLRTRQASANGAVQWVDPRVFAEMGVEPADPAAAPGKKCRRFLLPWEQPSPNPLLRKESRTVPRPSPLPGPWSRGPL